MKEKEEIIIGKTRMIITRSASGEDKSKEVVLSVFGPNFYIPKKQDMEQVNSEKDERGI